MPLMKCEKNGKSGWKYGESGSCYIGTNAKKEAVKQAVAIGKGKFPKDETTDEIKEIVEEMEKEYKNLSKKKKMDALDYFHIAIIKNVEEFEGGSFEYDWNFSGITGLHLCKGKLKNDPNELVIQRLEFYSEQFSEGQAKEYLKENNYNYINFILAKKTFDHNDSVQRFDVFEITQDNMTEPFRKTPEGYLKGRAIVTNTGIFRYRKSDGSFLNELRTPEEIGRSETLDSLVMQIMTDNHPNEEVNAENAKKLQVGFTGENVNFDGFVTSIPITITDAKTIDKIEKDGKVSLSCGYFADLKFEDGYAFGNNKYDAIQTNIRYNHIAIVDRGRAGDLAKIKLRMDSQDAININENTIVDSKNQDNKKNKEIRNMSKIKLNDNVEFEVDSRVAEEFEVLKKDKDTLKTQLGEKEATIADKDKTISDLQGKNDSLNDQIESLKVEIPKQVKAELQNRIALVDAATKYGVEVKDEMDDISIKKEIILKVFPKADFTDKDEHYIEARYDSAKEILDEQPANKNKQALSQPKTETPKKDSVEDTRKKHMKNLWKLNSDQADNYRNGIITDEMKNILEEE